MAALTRPKRRRIVGLAALQVSVVKRGVCTEDSLLIGGERNRGTQVSEAAVRREAIVSVKRFPALAVGYFDQRGIICRRVQHVLAAFVDVNLVFCDAHDRAYGNEHVPLPESKETAGVNLQHSNLALVGVDKEAADITNFRTMKIEDVAAAYVLDRVGWYEIRIVQILELHMGCALLTQGTFLIGRAASSARFSKSAAFAGQSAT